MSRMRAEQSKFGTLFDWGDPDDGESTWLRVDPVIDSGGPGVDIDKFNEVRLSPEDVPLVQTAIKEALARSIAYYKEKR